jgi:hypothetical protein
MWQPTIPASFDAPGVLAAFCPTARRALEKQAGRERAEHPLERRSRNPHSVPVRVKAGHGHRDRCARKRARGNPRPGPAASRTQAAPPLDKPGRPRRRLSFRARARVGLRGSGAHRESRAAALPWAARSSDRLPLAARVSRSTHTTLNIEAKLRAAGFLAGEGDPLIAALADARLPAAIGRVRSLSHS